MRKSFILLLLACLSLSSVQACVHKKQVAVLPDASDHVLIGYVMDTTQALLPAAKVSINDQELTTLWDGRFVFKKGQWSPNAKLKVSCAGYKSQQLSLSSVDTHGPLIIKLTAEKKASTKESETVLYSAGGAHTRRTTDSYSSKALVGAVPEDGAMPVLVEMESAAMPLVDAPMELSGKKEYYMPNASAGMLTAGEVNDFTKWKFWSSIIDSTHQKFISDWRITARERYTVQVMDTHTYPLAGKSVNLLDDKGNTLFQAITDNTGKAELWLNLFSGVHPYHGACQVQVEDQTLPAKEWLTVTLDEPCNNPNDQMVNDQMVNDVDVFFVFDATGSMGDELRYLQAEMKDVISRAKEATGGLRLRTGAVVYRDHQDEYLTRISRLTEDISTTQAFIDKQVASGGGDYPEAIPEALMAALNGAGWDENARARIAFLILDAPCHKDSTTLALLHEQILNSAALGVRIVPVVCSGIEESGELLLRSIALATNGTSFFLTDDSGIGHSHLKPTTDTLKVEHLNDMLVRTIVEFSYMPDCQGKWHYEEIEKVDEAFIPNPFTANDLVKDPTIPHGPTTLYLLDISGKLIHIYEGDLDNAGDAQLSRLGLSLTTGVYFIKAFYDGEWHTKKILVH